MSEIKSNHWEQRISDALGDWRNAERTADWLRHELAERPATPLTVAEAIAYRARRDLLSEQLEGACGSARARYRAVCELASEAFENGLPIGVWMALDSSRAFQILHVATDADFPSRYAIETRPLAFWGDHPDPTEVEAEIRDLRQTERDARM